MAQSRQAAEIARLRAQLAERDAVIADLRKELGELKAIVKELLASRQRRSHVIAEGQGVLFPDGESGAGDADMAGPGESGEVDGEASDDAPELDAGSSGGRKRHPRRTRRIDTSSLAREDREHVLPEGQRTCPTTGALLVPVGEKVFEEIDYRRGHFVLIRHRQVVYGLPPEVAEDRVADPIVAPLPPRAIEGCTASAELIAWLIVQKYANHLPLYRQAAICARDGLRLARQTLCDWTLMGTEVLAPLVDCQFARIREGPVLQLDDTPVKCQAGRGQANFQACLWTFVNPEVPGVVYRFTLGRSSKYISADLSKLSGWLVGDGFSGNSAGAKAAPGDIVLVGCWAHTIRKFRDARSESAKVARLFESDIRALYRIEKAADKAEDDHQQRLERRQAAVPVLARLFERAERMREDYGDAGLMAEAIRYLLNQREPLSRFLEDARIPLDNNSCELAIRPIAIGRRNWLFAGSERGGRAAAVAYSIIESCRRAGIDPQRYIADVLVRMATHPMSRLHELLPESWAATVGAAGEKAVSA